MKSIYRLKKNYQYNYVYKHSQSVADNYFVLLYTKSNVRQTKFGFSVSKKFGHAVQRNRIRRQMKAAVSGMVGEVKSGYNAIFIPRKSQAYDYAVIVDSFRRLLTRAELMQ